MVLGLVPNILFFIFEIYALKRDFVMNTHIKTGFLLYTFTLFLCLNFFFLGNTEAQNNTEPVVASANDNYTFKTIDVPDVDFLAVTASSDFEDYAGYTKGADGEKIVGFTLIDGVFTTHDFLGSQGTYFYALGNDGQAAGYYEDSDGLHRGVILGEDGELRQYDFPGSVQTEIYGISDATGALTGDFIDATGVRRGFSGDTIVEVPEALATYAAFTTASGAVLGSYIDADGLYHSYVHAPDGRFIFGDVLTASNLEYAFTYGVSDVGVIVARVKIVDDVPRTYVGRLGQLHELQVPGSVSTEGWNINRDGSIVGHYDAPDGHRYGFTASPAEDTTPQVDTQPVTPSAGADYTFESIDVPGVDFLELTASSDFEDYAGHTRSADSEKVVGFTLIDGVFTTYDFPGAQNTYFYALGNNGQAAGHYEDSDGLHHGVVLENGKLRQYNFPDAVQTEIYGISDATGALTGNFIDATGVRRGFSGDTIVEVPEALATYADFVSGSGVIVGSYIDSDGLYHAYGRAPDGRFVFGDVLPASNLEYMFTHGINDVGVIVTRVKPVDDVPRTYVGKFGQPQELQVPGSVITEGWNVNQDGSVVGNYVSAEGHRRGFIARPEVDTAPPVADPPVVASADSDYTFESIDVPGVDFLAVTASSDFEGYAGYTKSADGEKEIAFTLIDDVFTTYDFPGSQNTYFFALGNNGDAAGHYEDSDGLYHGIVLENGELRQYDFPGSVETEIYGISDETGALTGNFTDAQGVRRGFTGDTVIEAPGAAETFADFVSEGRLVGSYIDTDGLYHTYVLTPDGEYRSVDIPNAAQIEFVLVHGINKTGVYVTRSKLVGDVTRTHVSTFRGRVELQFPESVSTEGWNINQDGSVVGYYELADGRRYGFIARPAGAPALQPTFSDYTFESIDVPGIEFLALTASSDFEDYAGYTKSADGEKEIAFTLIDGVFTTYAFPNAENTYFYALGNDGRAAGHYQDSEGFYHGVILEKGVLRQYDFPGSVETEIYGISDETGALTGNFTDAQGVRRGFTGDTVIEAPGAAETFADFVAAGRLVGSYVDAEGLYHGYIHTQGQFTSIDLADAENLEYYFFHAINTTGIFVDRSKRIGDVPRTYVGSARGRSELQIPGSVSTEGWNINQDGSVVGHYDSPDGRRHGFIARPASPAEAESYGNAYTVTLSKGLNMLSVPLASPTPMTAKTLVAMTGATTIVTLDAANQRFVAWTPGAPNDGFSIEGGKGYIVNVPQTRNFAFVGSQWTNQTEETAAAAPSAITPLIRGDRGVQEAWAFVVSGHLEGKPAFDGYQVIARNLRTNSTITASVQGDYFAAATADLARRSVVQVGDVIELRVIGPAGNAESQPLTFKVTPEHLANAVLSVRLDGIGRPEQNLLLQNYPNPFNPETWIPYQLSEDSPVSISIYDTTGRLVRTLSLGFQSAGFYNSQGRSAYWDGRNALGERVASGIYFYQLTTPTFQQTRRLVIVK